MTLSNAIECHSCNVYIHSYSLDIVDGCVEERGDLCDQTDRSNPFNLGEKNMSSYYHKTNECLMLYLLLD